MSFALDVSKFVEKAKKNPETVMRSVSFKLFSAIIMASPVDTGRFRMNWQAAGGLPASGELPGEDKTGKTAEGRAQEFVKNSEYWEEFTLTNNLPYAEIIEFGGYSTGFMGPQRPDASGLASFTGPIKHSSFVGPKRQREQKTVNGFSKQAPQGVVRVNITRFNALLEAEAAKVR
ncbi:putative tail protein [Serratia phage Tsm2]|uniref:Putative tail protein n=1 Tax=Serratia phage Tsm2 TaxID=2787014 RepID=A0A7S9SP78_9CAUD|nr:putative tail protein [Serratia phage Tsm2]QPI13739.1 putative tail protein [Serratia phage Tsm2]